MDNIKDIVHNVIKNLSTSQPGEQANIERAWRQALNPKEIEHTRLVGAKDGRLSVCVDSSSWLYQMNVQKPRILAKIKTAVPEIKAIHFRIGRIK